MLGLKVRNNRKKKRLASRPLPTIQLATAARYEVVDNDDDDDDDDDDDNDLKNVSQDEFPATSQEEAYSIDTDEKEPLYEIPALK